MPDDLRSAVIKLAHAQPALRKPLLAVLREAADGPSRDIRRWRKIKNEPFPSYTWTDGKTTLTIQRRDQQGYIYYALQVVSSETYMDGRLIFGVPHEMKELDESVDFLASIAVRLYGKIQSAAKGEDVNFDYLTPKR